MLDSRLQNAFSPRRPACLPLVLVLAFAVLTACASAKVVDPRQQSTASLEPRPSVVWIEDFDIPPAMEADPDDRELAHEIAKEVARTAVVHLKKDGYPVESASEVERGANATPASSVLVVSGRFDEIDDGNMLGRILIGFGLGATHIRSQVVVAHQSNQAVVPVFDCGIEANGAKMPGLIVPLGLASEIGLIVNGVFKAAGEIKGPLAGDARRTGEKLAQRLAKYFQSVAWSGSDTVWSP